MKIHEKHFYLLIKSNQIHEKPSFNLLIIAVLMYEQENEQVMVSQGFSDQPRVMYCTIQNNVG